MPFGSGEGDEYAQTKQKFGVGRGKKKKKKKQRLPTGFRVFSPALSVHRHSCLSRTQRGLPTPPFFDISHVCATH